VGNLQKQINSGQTVGSVRLFSIRHSFPSQWAKFKSVTINATTLTAQLQLTLTPQLYPYWAQDIVASGRLKAVELFAEMTGNSVTPVTMYDNPNKTGTGDILTWNPSLGNLLSGHLVKIGPPAAVTVPTDPKRPPLTLYFDNNNMDDLWLALTWGKS
jgi:hypothetical protein